MKTMTCRQLGGPCDLALQGEDGRRGHQGPGPAAAAKPSAPGTTAHEAAPRR